MTVITSIPWHVYLSMLLFAITIGVLTASEVHELRGNGAAGPLRRDPGDEVDET